MHKPITAFTSNPNAWQTKNILWFTLCFITVINAAVSRGPSFWQGMAHIFIKQEDPFMLTNAILPATFGAFGMIAALLIYVNIIKSPAGEGRVKEIADEIHLGAMVFMASEYKRLAIFCLICIVALYASLGADTAISFTLGALCSGVAGYIGMYSATKANVRTAVAANTKGAAAALNVAFFGGSIMGLTVASMGLLGIGTLYFFMGGTVHGSKPSRVLQWVAHQLPCLAVLVVVSLPKVPMWAPTLLVRLKQASLRMILVTQRLSPTMLAIMLVTSPVWVQIFLNHIVVQ